MMVNPKGMFQGRAGKDERYRAFPSGKMRGEGRSAVFMPRVVQARGVVARVESGVFMSPHR